MVKKKFIFLYIKVYFHFFFISKIEGENDFVVVIFNLLHNLLIFYEKKN